MDTKPQIFVIAGPNGAGKTTSAKKLLPKVLLCEEYVNADAVAAGLSPFHPDKVQIQAGRLMLDRIHLLSNQKVNFSFETTLASRTFIKFLSECKNMGYSVNILFLWLHSPDLAIQRVRSRVEQGGHDIPVEVINRCYYRSIENFLKEYTQVATNWFLYDNCESKTALIEHKIQNYEINVVDRLLWDIINKGYSVKEVEEREETNDFNNDFNLTERIDYGVKAGVRDALMEHKRTGKSIYVLKNGEIVEIPPAEIEVADIPLPSFHNLQEK